MPDIHDSAAGDYFTININEELLKGLIIRTCFIHITKYIKLVRTPNEGEFPKDISDIIRKKEKKDNS